MNLFISNNTVVGMAYGDVTHWYRQPIPTDYTTVPVAEELAARLIDVNDPLHATYLRFSKGKIVVPNVLPKVEVVTVP